MNLRQTLTGMAVIGAWSAVAAAPTPWVAGDTILVTLENLPVAAFDTASTTALGSVSILKSGAKATALAFDPSAVQDKLQYVLKMNGMSLSSRVLYKTATPKVAYSATRYQRIDETGAGARNQCVAFAKAMTGAWITKNWLRGQALAELYPKGKAPSQLEAMAKLRPGTMIANFDGSITYPNSAASHVAIVLSVDADKNGVVQAVNVIDQNGMAFVNMGSVSVNVGDDKTGDGGTIMKHRIPWDAGSTRSSFSAKNYHVVNKP